MKITIDNGIIKNKDIRDFDKLVFGIVDTLAIDNIFMEYIEKIEKAFNISVIEFRKSLDRLEKNAFVKNVKTATKDGKIIAFRAEIMNSGLSDEILETVQKVKDEQEQEKERRRMEGLRATSDELEVITRIISYLNEKTGKHFKANTKGNKTLLLPLIRSKDYQEGDFYTVIDNMCSWWKGNPNMERYLRPQTLFTQTHMDKYLNMGKHKDAKTEIAEKREERDEKRKNASSKGWG